MSMSSVRHDASDAVALRGVLPAQAQANLDAALAVLASGVSPTFPERFGEGASERCIETVWASAHLPGVAPKVLDVGFTMSSLDYLGLLIGAQARLGAHVQAVDIVRPQSVITRYPEAWRTVVHDTPIQIGDVRTLELEPGAYDVATCISTIEHIGFDAPSKEGQRGAFDRPDDEADAPLTRDLGVTGDVMAAFARALKPGGIALVTAPMGRGGPATLRDSLGLVARQWEYDAQTWAEVTSAPGFVLDEARYFRCDDDRFWREVSGPGDLTDRSSHKRAHAQGCALAKLRRL